MPQCRICKRQINKITEKENIDWVMPSRNWYFCKKCYDDWKNTSHIEEEDWELMIYDFLARDLKVTYDYFVCEAQRKKIIKDKITNNKGIYFTLKYFYEVKNGSWDKAHGGIGIVPYIFNEAKEYWLTQEQKKNGFIKDIERQIKERSEREIIKIKRPQSKKKKEKYNLEDV